MQSLPLPRSGHISAILHLSDIHIRVGTLERSRYNDFVQVFDNLEQIIVHLPQTRSEEIIAVCTGDFFHYKNKLDSLSVRLFNILVDKITQRMPLFLIQGNHDFLQSDGNIPDVLSSLLHGHHNPMLCYLDHTGHYIAGNIGFGVVALKDALQIGNGTGYVEKLPQFPPASMFPETVTTKIALFHGTINNAIFYNGQNATGAIPINWITSAGYNIAMLGDIHKAQINPSDGLEIMKHFTWGYAGSLLQQDFGEEPIEHGILLWDLVKQIVVHYDVPSPTLFLNISEDHNQLSVHLNKKIIIPFEQFSMTCLKHLNIKIKDDVPTTLIDKLQSDLASRKITCNFVKCLTAVQLNGDSKILESTKQLDIAQYNTKDSWIDYIQKVDNEHQLDNQPWKEWIQQPEKLLLTNLDIKNNGLDKTIKTRDEGIMTAINELTYDLDNAIKKTKEPFYLLHMTWDWVLCYGRGNYYDFTNGQKQITIVNGDNSSGKTSFTETIAFGLYGKEIPSRGDRSNTSVMICRRKVSGEGAQITIVFAIGNEKYKISRTLAPQNKSTKTLLCKRLLLEQLTDDAHTITTSIHEAYEWMTNHVGSFESFMMSCLVSQNSDFDFFDLKDGEQIKLLDEVLHLNCIDSVSLVIKKASLALDELLNQCNMTKTYIVSHQQHPNHLLVEQLESRLTEQNKKLVSLKTQHDQIPEKWHHLKMNDLKSDDFHITQQISYYQQLVKIFEQHNVTMDSLLQEKATLLNQIKTLGVLNSTITYHDQISEELKKLQSKLILKPHCDATFYRQELSKIEKWKSENKPTMNQPIHILITQKRELETSLQSINKTLSSLQTQKPNRPEVSMEQYIRFTQQQEEFMSQIKRVGFETPNQMTIYCQTHPLPIINQITDPNRLKNQLSDGIKCLLNHSWYDLPIPTLVEMIKTEEAKIVKSETDIDALQKQLDETSHQTEQLLHLIESDEQRLIQIGHLIKPKITWIEVQQWLEKYNQMSDKETLQQQLLITYQKQNEQKQLCEDLQRKLDIIKQELEQITSQHMFYNPQCWACQKQSWKIRQNQLEQDFSDLTQKINLINVSDLSEIPNKLHNVRIWLDDFHIMKQRLSDYQHLDESWKHYNKYYDLSESISKTKKLNQEKLLKSRTSEANIHKQLNQQEKSKQQTQSLLDGLHTAINKIPQLHSIQKQIDDLNQWNKDSSIHQLNEEFKTLNIVYYEQQKLLIDGMKEWETRYSHIDEKSRKVEDSLIAIEKEIELLNEHEHIEIKQQEILENLGKYSAYEQHVNQIKALKYCLYRHQLEVIEEKITKLQNQQKNLKYLQYWTDIQMYKPSYYQKQLLNDEIRQLEQKIQSLNIDYGHQKNIHDQFLKEQKEINEYDILITRVSQKYTGVKKVEELMSGYRIWLYEKIVIPEIVRMINTIASETLHHNDFLLKSEVISKSNKINIDWSIVSPSGVSTIEKSGGFIRHLYGLIARITLSKQHCCNINNTQLILDESFVSSDVHNLEKIPMFLSRLLSIFPNGIILMSHIQTIKDTCCQSIDIRKNNDNTSSIRFGKERWESGISSVVIPPTMAIGLEKKPLKLRKPK